MKYLMLFLVFLQFGLGSITSQPLSRVTANSGLILRSEPSLEGNRIGKIPFENLVEVLERTDLTETIMDDVKEIKGNWVKVRFLPKKPFFEDFVYGYVFDGFLEENTDTDFQLSIPDKTKILALHEGTDPVVSIAYLYLETHYQKLQLKQDPRYHEWEPNGICGFNQVFEHQIKYSVTYCEEGKGISEKLTFPKTKLYTMKKFIEYLFFEEGNTWKTDYRYEPDGAGCYYEIKQTNTNTIIEIYCGC